MGDNLLLKNTNHNIFFVNLEISTYFMNLTLSSISNKRPKIIVLFY
jgi:hypothetical protein